MNLLSLRPDAIQSALARAPIAWVPLGAIEWHGRHAPVGLDCLTSEGLCQRAADQVGGVVLPPIHYGAYASIAGHPWTILLDQEESELLLRLLLKTLSRLEHFGVKTAVIVTGHFATEQLRLLEELASEWSSVWRAMKLVVLSPTDCPDLPIPPDHGGLFETSLLHAIDPEQIDLGALPDDVVEEENPAGPQRRDPAHPLFGIIGTDPRSMDEREAQQLLTHLVEWMTQSVTESTI